MGMATNKNTNEYSGESFTRLTAIGAIFTAIPLKAKIYGGIVSLAKKIGPMDPETKLPKMLSWLWYSSLPLTAPLLLASAAVGAALGAGAYADFKLTGGYLTEKTLDAAFALQKWTKKKENKTVPAVEVPATANGIAASAALSDTFAGSAAETKPAVTPSAAAPKAGNNPTP